MSLLLKSVSALTEDQMDRLAAASIILLQRALNDIREQLAAVQGVFSSAENDIDKQLA